jgi:hypothetical protein
MFPIKLFSQSSLPRHKNKLAHLLFIFHRKVYLLFNIAPFFIYKSKFINKTSREKVNESRFESYLGEIWFIPNFLIQNERVFFDVIAQQNKDSVSSHRGIFSIINPAFTSDLIITLKLHG